VASTPGRNRRPERAPLLSFLRPSAEATHVIPIPRISSRSSTALREAIEHAIPVHKPPLPAAVVISHRVVSAAFAGKGMLETQRLVYSAIAHLMRATRRQCTPSTT